MIIKTVYRSLFSLGKRKEILYRSIKTLHLDPTRIAMKEYKVEADKL